MRHAIVSDIHSNLQALDEVLSLIDTLSVDSLICLGDIVGYGADPSPCIARIRERSSHAILGNHDAAAVGKTSAEYFNAAAREAILWTGRVLAGDDSGWLGSLPLTGRFEQFETVHATPDAPELWKYLLTAEDAAEMFGFLSRRVLFYGHTHYPVVFEKNAEGVRTHRAESFSPAPENWYIVNVGSVGQPRDNDPRASFVVFDTVSNEIEFHRQPYDIAGAQKRILDSGLPPVLAHRLAFGR